MSLLKDADIVVHLLWIYKQKNMIKFLVIREKKNKISAKKAQNLLLWPCSLTLKKYVLSEVC